MTKSVAGEMDEIKRIFSKIGFEHNKFVLFAGRVLLGETYLCFRCHLIKKEFFGKLKNEYSNSYCLWVHEHIIEIAINEEEKLLKFLGSGNKLVRDGSVEFVI